MKEILIASEKIKDTIIEHRRFLHKNAEVGFDLKMTNSYITLVLEKLGCVAYSIGKGGIYTLIGNPNNQCILLRADTDALRMTEETDLSYKSTNGCMHSCGHDMHTAMLLGCAEILKEAESTLKYCVKLLFQPAEEILQGALDCIENGILDNPRVIAAFSLHCAVGIPLECGSIIIPDNLVSAPGADYFNIRVEGRSAHSSTPEKSKDALYAAVQIYNLLSDIVCNEVSPASPSLIKVCKLHSGDSGNVIPQNATINGTVRYLEKNTGEQIKAKINDIAISVANISGCRAFVEFGGGCPPLIISYEMKNKLYKFLKKNIENVYMSNEINKGLGISFSGSEDFAYFSEQVPCVTVAIAAGSKNEGYDKPLHNPKTLFDENALSTGAAYYSMIPFII